MAETKKYFNQDLADGLSGDDVNRRMRERNLGFAEPSADWGTCGNEIRCIWPDQHVNNPVCLGKGQTFYHIPATFLGLEVFSATLLTVLSETAPKPFVNREEDKAGVPEDTVKGDRHVPESAKYTCTCDNDGPRWTRDDQCCQGCFNWAFDHHYDRKIHGAPTWIKREFIEGNTWGIHVENLYRVLES
jgi:hypothetical protein